MDSNDIFVKIQQYLKVGEKIKITLFDAEEISGKLKRLNNDYIKIQIDDGTTDIISLDEISEWENLSTQVSYSVNRNVVLPDYINPFSARGTVVNDKNFFVGRREELKKINDRVFRKIFIQIYLL